jgi:pyruvate/2-oxoglutarate/acetoin dehydrogenase E1 component
MKYVEYLNGLIRSEVQKSDNCVLFGQNIDAGSCLGGLTRNIKVNAHSRIFNSTNAEYSLTGFGFGLMMNGASGVFLMKQLDFLLLGIDHIVNTYNIIRNMQEKYPNGSFTIVPTVVDSGYDGPQSSFNNFHDLCSIARVKGFTVSNKTEADHLFANQLMKPGFRIIALSQRLGKHDIIENKPPVGIFGNGEIFHYRDGKDVTVVSSNFSYPQADQLVETLLKKGIQASHFNISSGLIDDLDPVMRDIALTKKLIVIDDSKSIHTPVDQVLAQICGMDIQKKIVLKRQLKEDWLHPVSDIFEIDESAVLDELKSISAC